ncbi:MAG: hypothetical protein R3A12_03150 [Ignavibacteria bacterium]
MLNDTVPAKRLWDRKDSLSDSDNSKVVNQDYIIQDYEDFSDTEKYNREKAAIGFILPDIRLQFTENDIQSL